MKFHKGDIIYREIPYSFDGNKWDYKTVGPFKVMGQIEKYLMVRSKGAMPFILPAKDAIREKPHDET